MLATFCLRLACGLAGSLFLLWPEQVNPRFFRTHFLTVLGLTVVAAAAERGSSGLWFWAAAGAGITLAFLGSISWSLEKAPAGRALVVLTTTALVAALILSSFGRPGQVAGPTTAGETVEPGTRRAPAPPPAGWVAADDLTSAAVLGTSMTAMLVGHSYLIAPTMSIAPLMRLLYALFAALGLRLVVAGLGLWSWTSQHSLAKLEGDTVLWLPLRWGLGFILPFVLGWMARETAKIRSTQSATGILYVAVIFCFLGELTSQLLRRNTGCVL